MQPTELDFKAWKRSYLLVRSLFANGMCTEGHYRNKLHELGYRNQEIDREVAQAKDLELADKEPLEPANPVSGL